MTTVYEYKTLNEVPVPWRKHKGGRLSVEQINRIMKRAHQLNEERPAYARARAEFEEEHEMTGGQWRKKAATPVVMSGGN